MWDNTILPLFGKEAGKFVQTIKFPDKIHKKGLVLKQMSDCHHNPPCSITQRAINHPDALGTTLTDDEFINRLIEAGWTREDAEAELKSIEEDIESEL